MSHQCLSILPSKLAEKFAAEFLKACLPEGAQCVQQIAFSILLFQALCSSQVMLAPFGGMSLLEE